MKKIYFAVATIIAALASVNVNAQNKLGVNDVDYQITKFEQTHFVDKVVYSAGSDAHEYTAGELAKDGAYIGLSGGGQYFDGHFEPFIGASLGWDGGKKVPLGFEYMGTFNRGTYTDEADRSNSYVEFDSKFIGKLRLYTSQNKVFQLYLDGYFSYKLNFDYHKNESEKVTVKETDDEIITTKEKLGNDYEFKGSSMGYGAMLEAVIRPWMSRHSFRIFAGGGQQQRYYSNGNRWKPEFFAGVKWTYNFSAAELWDQAFLKKAGLTKKQAKKLSKQQRVVNTTPAWY